jgi:hypothetical protein
LINEEPGLHDVIGGKIHWVTDVDPVVVVVVVGSVQRVATALFPPEQYDPIGQITQLLLVRYDPGLHDVIGGTIQSSTLVEPVDAVVDLGAKQTIAGATPPVQYDPIGQMIQAPETKDDPGLQVVIGGTIHWATDVEPVFAVVVVGAGQAVAIALIPPIQ